MRKFLYVLVVILSSSAGLATAQPMTSSCMANPCPVRINQPDGSTVTVYLKGNSVLNSAETTDGYTVLNLNGKVEYAARKDDDLIATGILAHDDGARTISETKYLSNVARHITYGSNKVASILGNATSMNKQNVGNNSSNFSSTIQAYFPKKGKRHVLVLLIQFKDSIKSTYTKSNFNDLMNQHGYNGTNSFSDYFKNCSFGNLDLSVDVFGWYTSKYDPNYYSYSQGMGACANLVAEAVDAAHKAGVNFSKYDNDGDGNVDGVIVVHAGSGTDYDLNHDHIWSNASDLSYYGLDRNYNNVKVSHYTIQAETVYNTMIGIGVFCHEFGHLLGLPDLYDTHFDPSTSDYYSQGAGNYDVMAGGAWNNYTKTPATLSAFCKVYFNWVKPVVISSAGTYTLKPTSQNPAIFKIKTPATNEYYLLENRQYTGFDSSLPTKGLAIWHVDSLIMNDQSNQWMYYNAVNDTISSLSGVNHYGLNLMQADGKFNLNHSSGNNGNRGDGGDLYPYLSKNTFDDATSPGARLYNRNKSGVRIFKITQNSDSSVSFNFGPYPGAAFNTSNFQNSICQNSPLTLQNTSTYARSYLWNFGDGTTDSVENPQHLYTKAGTYYIKLVVKGKTGSDVDSSLITVYPLPAAQFSVFKISATTVTINNNTPGNNYYTWVWGDNLTSYPANKLVSHKYQDTGSYQVLLIASNTYQCRDTFSYTVHLSTFLGINDAKSGSFQLSVYPNPFSTGLNLAFTLAKPMYLEVALYNTLGQKIKDISKKDLSIGTTTMNESDFGNLPSGLYFIGVTTGAEKPQFIKVIKN